MYYFASDIHLGLEEGADARVREKVFIQWLDKVSVDAKAIYLVGDVFDFWFEYKRVIPKGHTRLLGKLSEMTDNGVEIHFFAGNHDMWLGDYLSEECGLILHNGHLQLDLYNKKVFIAHGDNMYIDAPFAEGLMNKVFRSKFLRKAFSSLVHPDLAIKFGRWWSRKSRKSKHIRHEFQGEGEYLIKYAREYLKTNDIDYFIFGHIHCANVYDLGNAKAVFLGEWIDRPTFAVMDSLGEIDLKLFKTTANEQLS